MKYKAELCKIGDKDDLALEGYLYEPKLDGIRALCEVSPKSMKFFTRNDNNVTTEYPELNFRKSIKAKSCILDGEIVIYDKKGKPSFHLWQLRKQHDLKAVYVVFDILSKDGKSLLKKPLYERKQILEETIKESKQLELIPFSLNGKKLWKIVSKLGLEGVIAKKIDSTYKPGKRPTDWLKVKLSDSADCVIVGYTQKKREVSSLALGLYKKGELHYIGKVGTGFNAKDIVTLYNKLEKLETDKPPVVNPGRMRIINWVKPKLVAEIKYVELTKGEHLRAPVFLHLRPDKKPKGCTFKANFGK